MDQYVTGAMIRRLREERKLTQQQLAEAIRVSDKTVSKWETGRGYPDISLLEPLSAALGISLIELLSGEHVSNTNRASDLLRAELYVCPICGNVAHSTGRTVVSCCGLVLPPLEAEPENGDHRLRVERIEDELYVTVPHEMSKTHYISFLAAVGDDGFALKKLYPEGDAAARFPIGWTRYLLWYCNRHGLFKAPVR